MEIISMVTVHVCQCLSKKAHGPHQKSDHASQPCQWPSLQIISPLKIKNNCGKLQDMEKNTKKCEVQKLISTQILRTVRKKRSRSKKRTLVRVSFLHHSKTQCYFSSFLSNDVRWRWKWSIQVTFQRHAHGWPVMTRIAYPCGPSLHLQYFAQTSEILGQYKYQDDPELSLSRNSWFDAIKSQS